MTRNEQLITNFYSAFQNRDYKTMQECYAGSTVIFTDPVFINLTNEEVKAMWEMFCVKGKEMQINFSNVQADEKNGSAQWVATYIFSATGRKVRNVISAKFVFENGKIVNHTDSFHFYKWASQAFGFTGVLLGHTSYFKNKVKAKARKNLLKFMSAK